MVRRRSGSSYRPDKRKTRDWDDPEDAAERSRRVFYERFDEENISRLWRRYDADWHHKPGERFLTRKEFTDLVEELHTTKITTIHDEGMRRLKEAGRMNKGRLNESRWNESQLNKSRMNEGRLANTTTSPRASYVSTTTRAVSITSLPTQWSSRTATPQPRGRHSSTPSTAAPEQDQSPTPPFENCVKRARSFSLDVPKVTISTTIKTQLSPTKAEHKPKLSDIPALTPAPPSASPSPLHLAPSTASPTSSLIVKLSPCPSPSPRKSRFSPLESPAQSHSQTPSETPPPPPPPQQKQQQQQQRQQPYIPPTPAELDTAISLIRTSYATEEAQALARHTQQVKAAKALVWIEAIKLAGEIPCLAALVSGASGEGGEGAATTGGRGEKKSGPEGMTESALISAFAGLIRWEEGAEKARECLVEAVGGLEGLGMGGEVKGVGERVRGLMGLMGRVGRVRRGVRDCLVLVGRRGGVVVGEGLF
ncbi:hypothetical protein VC83_01799 [Pseudogymnoascus destructans]|uniref:Uncharacterized protein n=1 Tax=Pseudogymnoascus destructans TaxID=655981 RepID=A0A177AI85_9PEZI|nr:uncharacterized protein VC83_01799 [Pseudogymnoascus destructans]OAF61788.1 hypothetical protein VC83_01799 [Pseudogymnoascus destructans]